LVQKCYWGDKDQTNFVMRKDEDGRLWMYTGDQATLDSDGYLRIVGRTKVRGTNVLVAVDKADDTSHSGYHHSRRRELVSCQNREHVNV